MTSFFYATLANIRNPGFFCSTFLGPAVMVAVLSSCGGGVNQPITDAERADPAEMAYEPSPTFSASELLPTDLLKGEHHEILEMVQNDGYENRYTIVSDFGTFEAHRSDFVEERVNEVYALAELDKVTQSQAFAQGVAQAATSPFRALKNLATRPAGTVTGIFAGVGALLSQTGEMVSGNRGELEDSAAEELIGFGQVKRGVANLLSVDPYTTNPAVQEGLGEVSWAGFAGGLSLAPLTAQVGGGAGAALSGLQNSKSLNSLLTSQSPEALRDINRGRMRAMDIDKDLTEKFLLHPWLSPRHETVIVAAMMGLKDAKNRDALFEQALSSDSEEQSIFVMRMAEASLGLHQNVVGLAKLERLAYQVFLHTNDNRVICLVPADHLIWGSGASAIADQTIDLDGVMELWLTGTISDRARREFSQRGWSIVTNASDRLLPNLDAVELDSDSKTTK
ncbi:MAG: hypothetical protein ACJZ9F_02410 [Rhodospirillaceae bacterium]